ncbi:MAG: hypothetical protein ACJ74Q_14035 [Pyrinomonadaceae bacterium]
MQDERSENSEGHGVESQQVDNKRWELARSVLKEAIAEAGIKDISEYKGESLNLRWHVFSQENDQDVILKMQVGGGFGRINADVSLAIAAKLIVDEVDNVLFQPDVARNLEFTGEDRPEILRNHARMILRRYVAHIPVVTFHILSQALGDAVQSHIKNVIEPALEEHREAVGLTKDFTISPSEAFSNELQSIDRKFISLRKGFLGDKRERLTPEKRAHLDEEYEQLRAGYEAAKDFYSQSRKAFFAGGHNRTNDEWVKEWEMLSSRIFPNLYYRCLADIDFYPPYELAHSHLEENYGYSVEYIKKLISKAKSLKRE